MHFATILINLMLAVFLNFYELPPTTSDTPPLLIAKNVSFNLKVSTTVIIESKPVTEEDHSEVTMDSLKFNIAQNTRYIEFTGYTTSLLSTSTAIYIFSVFSELNNKRTFIHKNLCWAILLENAVRLLIYSDQLIVRDKEQLEANLRRGIENMPYLCEAMYVILEYARVSAYTWTFVEGIYLLSLITNRRLRKELSVTYYCICGWLFPVGIVATWATLTATHYSEDKIKLCWYGYNYVPSYYIIQGPIFIVLALNFSFLLMIMCVVCQKLRGTYDSEMQKTRKAIRATLFLMPLLGASNILNLIDYPLDGNAIGFAIWCYSSHFFRSFQGFFIAVLYCFTNREVIEVVKKHWERCLFRMRGDQDRRRSCPRCTPDHPPVHLDNEGTENVPMRTMPEPQDQPSTQNTHDFVVTIEPAPGQTRQTLESGPNLRSAEPGLSLRTAALGSSLRPTEPGSSLRPAQSRSRLRPLDPGYERPLVFSYDSPYFRRRALSLVSFDRPPSRRIRVSIPGYEQLSPIVIQLPSPERHRAPAPTHRSFTRPGLVTYESRRRRSSALSACYI